MLSALREHTRPCFGSDLARLKRAEDIWHTVRERLAEAMQCDEAMRRMRTEHWARALRESALVLSQCRSLSALLSALAEHLDRLGFQRAYLALAQENRAHSRLVLGYDRDLPLENLSAAPVFPSEAIVPNEFMASPDSRFWVLLPLSQGERIFGHLLLDKGAGEGIVWESLRQQITAALAYIEIAQGGLWLPRLPRPMTSPSADTGSHDP